MFLILNQPLMQLVLPLTHTYFDTCIGWADELHYYAMVDKKIRQVAAKMIARVRAADSKMFIKQGRSDTIDFFTIFRYWSCYWVLVLKFSAFARTKLVMEVL